MLLTQRQLRPFAAANFLLPPLNPFPFPHSLKSSLRPTNQHSRCSAHKTWIARPSEDPTKAASTAPRPSPPAEGPVELPPSTPIFATSNEHTPLQTLTSVLLTGAITAFLFRSLRRRAQRAKETRFRSSGEKKSLAEEAVESSTSVTSSSVSKRSSSASPVEAFLGAVAAGGIALILFKFTTTVESALNRQTILDNYSVKAETLVLQGDPKDKICQAAEELHVDLVVVGSRGLGTIKRTLLGSVSNYSAHYAHCPVLIVNPPPKQAHD